MTGWFSSVQALFFYNIDPFRVYPVNNETRLLQIEQDTRIFAPIRENRLNTIEQETRVYVIPAETRNLEVQPLALVETVGNPLDRRQ